jgi:type I restriction enzyme S subunit
MTNWKCYKVSEFAEVIGGGTPKTGVAEYWNGDIPWITPKDLSSHKARYIAKGERNISQEGLKNSGAQTVPPNTVLLTSRAPVGYLAIAKNELTTNQGFRSLVARKGFSPEFVYYLLLNNIDYLKQHASGSTFQELSGGTLKNLEFQIPDYATQLEIAKILGDLDAKIELNQQMNKTLEAMAQALFKRWFVDFKFPGHEEVRFVDGLPEGWRSSEFGEIVFCVRNQVQPGEHLSNRNYVPIECMPMNQVCLSEHKSYAEAQSSLITFEKGDILFGAMRAYFHRVNYAPFAGITRTTVFVLRPKREHGLSYALCLMNLNESVEYANAHSRGSTMPYAVWDNSLEKMPVVLPPDDILIEFDKIIRPFIDAMNGNAEITRGLTQIRDSLLPRLMSGDVVV